jgi:hypothetical protein
MRKDQSIYVKLQSIRIGGAFPSGLFCRQETSFHQNYSIIEINLRLVPFCHQNKPSAKSFCHRSHLVAKTILSANTSSNRTGESQEVLPYRGTRTSACHNCLYFEEGMPPVVQRALTRFSHKVQQKNSSRTRHSSGNDQPWQLDQNVLLRAY